MPVNLPCPKCQKSLAVPTKKVGSTVACPACGTQFVAAWPPQQPNAATSQAVASPAPPGRGSSPVWATTIQPNKVPNAAPPKPQSAVPPSNPAKSAVLRPPAPPIGKSSPPAMRAAPPQSTTPPPMPAIQSTHVANAVPNAAVPPPPPPSNQSSPHQAPPPLPASNVVRDWFYVRDAQQVGPVSTAQLKAMISNSQLQRSDLVWKEGMNAWTSVNKVPQLIPAAQVIQGLIGIVGLVVVAIIGFGSLSQNGAIPNPLDGVNLNPLAADGLKLAAFRKLVAKYHQMPDKFAMRDEVEQFTKELDTLQDDFFSIPFDPKANSKEAKAILELYGREIENRYEGAISIQLGDYLSAMYSELIK